jgi:beta-glucanase (GH16 family)
MNGGGSGTGTSGYGAPAFDDEFNGTSLDTTNWVAGRREGGTSVCNSDCGGYNPDYESELFEPSAVTEANGDMTITATKQSPDGGQHSWTSGAVEMKPGKNFIYGYFEARVKVPAPSQAWTAYWLNGADTWPPEMDIFEFHFFNSQPTFNNDGLPGTQGANLSGWPNAEAYGGTSTDFTQWHTYGLLWTSSSIKVYFDGVLQSMDTSDTGIPSTSMYPLFDYAIDSTTPNPPSGSQMNVDYLRIWCPGGGTSCTTSK